MENQSGHSPLDVGYFTVIKGGFRIKLLGLIEHPACEGTSPGQHIPVCDLSGSQQACDKGRRGEYKSYIYTIAQQWVSCDLHKIAESTIYETRFVTQVIILSLQDFPPYQAGFLKNFSI